jgi:fatty-acyl-CoA synthase
LTDAAQSYVHGASSIELRGETVGRCFDLTVSRDPARLALISRHEGVRLTYADLAARVDAFAAGLIAMGLTPGERIGICAPNGWAWVVSQFATAKAGLILVNINPAYRLAELDYALKTVGCRALIVSARYRTSDYLAMLHELVPELATAAPGAIAAGGFPDLDWIITTERSDDPAVVSFADVPAMATDEHRRRLGELGPRLQFDDPINIQFTSGTTGTPKAAVLTHHNIVNNAYFVGLQMRLAPEDRLCIPVPMYHCFGMVLGTLCCIAHGATMVFPAAGFDAHETLRTIAEERCTALHGVPTMFIAALDEPDFASHDLTCLRTGVMAGAPCPAELMKRVMDEMNLTEITIAYGMTETGPVSFQTAIDDPVARRVGSVGRVLPHIEIKIVDEDRRIVPRGTPGELLTRGYCVMPRYWGDRERTAKAIDEARWIASGDVAVLDEDGYCEIVGRIKDMLIRGGENIFPREIEEFLYTHPDIDEVEVFGVPDRKYGEEVCAWIRLKPGAKVTADDVRDFCREKIAHYKIPRHVRFVDSFPMTVTGKVQKFVMREQMAEELAHRRSGTG